MSTSKFRRLEFILEFLLLLPVEILPPLFQIRSRIPGEIFSSPDKKATKGLQPCLQPAHEPLGQGAAFAKTGETAIDGIVIAPHHVGQGVIGHK